MKVKNIMFSGFAAAILMGAVDANAAFSIASKDYVDQQVNALSGENGAITTLNEDVDTLMGTGEGSVAKAEADAKQYTDDKIGTLAEGETVASTYQTIANKVSDLSGTVTDTQYPSALAVKNALTTTGGNVTTLSDKVGDEAMGTTATTVTGAIAELDGKVDTLTGNAETSGSVAHAEAAADAAQADADALETAVGDVDDFAADIAATDVVGAINELNTEKQNKSDSTVAAGTYKHLTAGAGVAGNLVALDTALGTVETTVGDANSGLLKDVADLKSNMGNSGSVAEQISDALGSLGTGNNTVADALADKQDNLTTEQLAAANSGIDATKVADYEAKSDALDGTCTSGSGYCALVKNQTTGAMQWVEITNPFTANNG